MQIRQSSTKMYEDRLVLLNTMFLSKIEYVKKSCSCGTDLSRECQNGIMLLAVLEAYFYVLPSTVIWT